MTRPCWHVEQRLSLAAVGILCLSVSATGLAGVDLNDPSLETDEFWQDYYRELSRLQQPLENNTFVNITVQSGSRAALSCQVQHLGSRPVSWIRRRDFHVLTSRDQVFTADGRFSVQRRVGSREDWALSIWPVTAADRGVYECQVSTGKGTLSRFVNVTVIEPAARILGAKVHRIEEGSAIVLLCVVDQAQSPVSQILWWCNNQTLAAVGRVQIQWSSDVSGPPARSQLHIQPVSFLDSGLYTCGGDNLTPDSVHVFVTDGDKTAAIQRRGPAVAVRPPPQLLLLGVLLCYRLSPSAPLVR